MVVKTSPAPSSPLSLRNEILPATAGRFFQNTSRKIIREGPSPEKPSPGKFKKWNSDFCEIFPVQTHETKMPIGL